MVTRCFKNYLDNYRNIGNNAWILLLLTFIESIGGGFGFFISLYFKSFLNLSIPTIGVIISFYGIGTIVGGKVGGLMVDKLSAVSTNIVSLSLFGISFLLLAITHTSSMLMGVMFCMGCSSYVFITSNSVLILKISPNEQYRLKLINLKNVISNLGMILAAITLTYYGNHDFRVIFFLMGGLLFLAAFIQHMVKQNYLDYSLVLPEKSMKVLTNSNQLFYITLICLFFVGLIVSQHKVVYPLYIKSNLSSLFQSSIILAFNPLLIIFFQPSIVNFIGRFNKVVLMGIGALGISLGMLVLSFSPSVILFFISVIFYTFGEMIFFSLSQLLCFQSQRENKKGYAIGMWRMVYATSNIVGPYAGARFFSSVGSGTTWFICGLLGIICLFLTVWLNNNKAHGLLT